MQRSYRQSSGLSNADKIDEDSVAGEALKLSVLDMIDALEDADFKNRR